MIVASTAAFAQGETQKANIESGKVKAVSLEQPVSTAIVSDPSVADVTLDGKTMAILFAKAIGTTEVIMLDDAHQQVAHWSISVVPSSDSMTVVKGSTRAAPTTERWDCANGACRKVSGSSSSQAMPGAGTGGMGGIGSALVNGQ
jgi:Flp pilus assembly secretin CpaC